MASTSPPSSAPSASSEEATTSSSDGGSAVQSFKYSRRASLRSVVGRPDGGLGLAGKRVVVGGWVKSSNALKSKLVVPGSPATARMPATETTTGLTCTEVLMARVPLIRCIARLIGGAAAVDRASSLSFKFATGTALVRINDGSSVSDLQIVVDSCLCPLEQVTAIGACVLVEGKIELVEGRSQQQHVVELRVDKVLHVGTVDIDKYPLSNVEFPPPQLVKDYPQLATRTAAMASVVRVRSEMIHAVHAFFQTNGFFHVNTPIITDTTVAGDRSKMFRVMRLKSKSADNRAITPEVVRASIKAKTKQIEALDRSESNREALEAAKLDLQRANELAQQLEQQGNAGDFSNDFFQHPVYLSPDHTLHLETYACALSSVYTFSPAFQAESLEPHKYLAERWRVSAELAFAELEDAISCAEDCLMWLLNTVSKNCSDELKFLSKGENNEFFSHIEPAVSSPWERITYNEAVNTLLQVKEKSFEDKVELGMPLSLQHMSYLVDDHYKKPVILYEYPKEQKPFYARLMEDGTKVSAFDMVLPKVGIIAYGAQKEERMDNLTARIDDLRLPRDHLEWYLDVRRHGTVKHSGFSIDIERLVLLVTCLNNI